MTDGHENESHSATMVREEAMVAEWNGQEVHTYVHVSVCNSVETPRP